MNIKVNNPKCKILNSLSGYDYLIWREREWLPFMMSQGVFELITLGTHEGKSLSDLTPVKREYIAMVYHEDDKSYKITAYILDIRYYAYILYST